MVARIFDTEAFDRATDGLLQFFTPQQAEALIQYRGDQTLLARIEELAQRNTEADLSEDEQAEYRGYVQANKFIATLQAKARKLLTSS